jgi:superfamily II DNA or RNA helicase
VDTQKPGCESPHIPKIESLLNTELDITDHDGASFSSEMLSMSGLLYIRALRIIAEKLRSRDIDETRDSILRPSKLQKLGREQAEKTDAIARQFAIIKNAKKIAQRHEKSFFDGARKHQDPYLRDLISFANIPPAKVVLDDLNAEPYETYIRGATIEAPTGSGKTFYIAKTLVGFGVGTEIEDLQHHSDPRIRALIIEPSQTLVEELTGKIGNNALSNFAPNINFGAYYQHEKNDDADAVVITIEQFIEAFRDGKLNGQTFDIAIIDEGHHLTEPTFKKAFFEHWKDGPALGFTATPKYFPGKDVRDLLPHHIFHGDITDYIETGGILNAAQLFSVRVTYDKYPITNDLPERVRIRPQEAKQRVLREASAEFLEPFIAEGRRGIIFCEQSDNHAPPAENARNLAARLSGLTRPDGTSIRTAVAGSINNGKGPNNPDSNPGIRRRYAAGEIDFIVTSEWGREGLNEDIDIVLCVGTITSLLKFSQQIGRGTRLSSKFPITVYGHIFTPATRPTARSLFSVFGLEEIEQGIVIGHQDDVRKTLRDGDVIDLQSATPRSTVSLEQFPERIRALLESINAATVGEALFDSEVYTPIPKGYVNFDEIIQDVPGSKLIIRKYLRDTLGYACVGRFTNSFDQVDLPEQGREFVYYFEPRAAEYLAEYKNVVARVELQREFGNVDVSIVDAIADACDIKPRKWFYYDGRFIPHYKEHEAKRIREKFHATPPAAETDYSRVRLASALNVRRQGLIMRLLPHEIAKIVSRRTTTENGKTRVLDHWQEKDALEIIARFKEMEESQGPPLYFVPRELAVRYVPMRKGNLTTFSNDTGVYVRSTNVGRPPLCFYWNVLARAAQEYGVRPGVPKIDFKRLPAGPEDKNPERLAYARETINMLQTLRTIK